MNGFKKFASLAGHCDYYSVVCTEHFDDHPPRHEDCLDFAVPADAEGLSIVGEWDPLGMRATASNDLIIKDVFVSEEDLMMPRGVFIKTLPQWPHMMALLSPANMGLSQGIFDFTVGYLRGEIPGQPPIDRRVYPTKRVSVGKMFQQLTLMRSNFTRVMMEAQGNPSKEQVMRMYVSQIAIMEDYLSIMPLYDMDEIDGIGAPVDVAPGTGVHTWLKLALFAPPGPRHQRGLSGRGRRVLPPLGIPWWIGCKPKLAQRALSNAVLG